MIFRGCFFVAVPKSFGVSPIGQGKVTARLVIELGRPGDWSLLHCAAHEASAHIVHLSKPVSRSRDNRYWFS